MFKSNDLIYTEENVYVENGEIKVFSEYKGYTVYETDEINELNELEPVIIGEDGMLHRLNQVGHMFMLAH